MRVALLYTCAIIVFTGIYLPAWCQSGFHINTAENLNTSMLTSVIRDRNNNMWIGSYNGLFKHEGSRIRTFNQVGVGSKSISGEEMHTIMEDRRGFIWIGTTNGLDKIDPVTYQIQHYPLRSTDASSSFVGYIYSVFQDEKENIWASTDAAMFRMDYQTGKYTTIPVTKDKSGMPSHLASYKTGVSTDQGLWIHTLEGMVYYEYSSGHFFHRYHNPGNKPIFNLNQTAKGYHSDLRADKKNNLWFVSNDNKLIRYNTRSEQLDSFVFNRHSNAWLCCYALAIDHRDNIWIGFRHGGLLIFDQARKTFTPVTGGSINNLIKSNYIYSLEEDYRGNMWVSTDNGLDIVNQYHTGSKQLFLSEHTDFVNLKYQMGTPTTDGHRYIYIPFYRFGFFRLDTRTDSVKAFYASDSAFKGTTYVIPQDENRAWLARNKKLLPYALDKGKVINNAADPLIPDTISKYPGDIIWHYKAGADIIYKKNTGSIYYLHADGKMEIMNGYGFKKNLCISSDSSTLWYVTSDLNLVNRKLGGGASDTIDLQKKLKSINFSFSNPRDMVDDGENIWMTSQNGLLRYNKSSGEPVSYTVQNGLVHSFTFSLCLDLKKRIWVGSLGGVDVYDKKNDRFKNIISHPIVSYMDSFGGTVMTQDGTIYFISGNKIFTLDPETVLNEPGKGFNLRIHEVMVNGETLDWRSDQLNELSYRQNGLLFRFGLLNFTQQSNVRYHYYLEGLEEKWNENISPGEISYNSLLPGKYVFHLKSTDLVGNLLAEEIALPIHIYPPFWQTWWFRTLCLLLIILVISSLFRRRINTIKTKAAIRLQMTELESKALRAQMNPHFIFNSLNAIQELIVTKNFTEAYQYLSSFSKLLRMVLNNSEKNFIPLSTELEMNRHYLELESLRFKQSFYYEIKVDDEIEEETTLVPSLLLQPFLENAIWHGLMHKEGDKRLEVIFKKQHNHIICVIQDNGIGRERSASIKANKIGASHFESKGMNLTRQRIEVLNKQLKENLVIMVDDLKNNDGEATGTRITITIPKKTTFIH